jgi:hypothetical protein
MRRWVLIILLLVYPFQVALAMADNCCATTQAGVTHHGATSADAAAGIQPLLVDDDGPALSDPHCPSCVFAHILYLPSYAVVFAPQRHHAPAARPERPKWLAATHALSS